MPTSDSNNRLELYKLLLSHYSNHKNSLYNCTNCNTGDTISRVTKIVAESTASIGTIENIESAIKLLEEVLENRGNDTSAWVQLELHKDLGKLYLRYGVTEEHKQKVNAVYEKFSSIKDNNTISRRLEEFKEIVDKINEKI
jgi:NADH dehydrogenase/NADH:ubiquinone oxidoreductase subunit G